MIPLLIIAGLVCVIALIATIMVGKDINSKLLEYEEKGETIEDELKRSHEYETQSLRVNVKSLTWIYAVLILISIFVCIGFFVY